MTKFKKKIKWWQNINCEKLKLWGGKKSKTPSVTKLKLWQNSNSDYDKTQKLKLWQNSKTPMVTKFELWQISIYGDKKNLKGPCSKNLLTPWQLTRCSLGGVLQFLQCFRTHSSQNQEKRFNIFDKFSHTSNAVIV